MSLCRHRPVHTWIHFQPPLLQGSDEAQLRRLSYSN